MTELCYSKILEILVFLTLKQLKIYVGVNTIRCLEI